MPQEPKKRHSRQRQGKRRSSIKLNLPAGVVCVNCGKLISPFIVCRYCGYYKGKQVLVIKPKPDEKK